MIFVTEVLPSIMTLLLHFAFWPAPVKLLSKWMIYFHKSCKICNKTTNTARQKMWHNARHMPLLLQQACNNYHNRLLTWKDTFHNHRSLFSNFWPNLKHPFVGIVGMIYGSNFALIPFKKDYAGDIIFKGKVYLWKFKRGTKRFVYL